MVERSRRGDSIATIAARHGLSANWTGALLRMNGVELPTSGRGFKCDLDGDEVAYSYESGLTVREIAEATETSYGKVWRLLRTQGVQMRPRGLGRY